MKKKKTTIRDIANELDVTASTVSRALRNHPRISTSTKEAVLDAAERLNYQPNSIAAALRKGKSNILGVMVPTSDRNFFASVIRGIEEVIRDEGYNLIICQSDDQYEKEQMNIDALLKIQVDGIIASVAKETTDFEHFEKVKSQGVPLILYDRVNDSLDVNAVVTNDYLGAYKAVNHLIDQGCRKIVHFAGRQHIKIYQDRLNGYIDAQREKGIPIENEFIMEEDLIFSMQKVVDLGQQLAERILDMPTLPDAIFSSSDFAAMGAMQVLKKHGISIPNDVAIVGYSNDVSGSFIEPSLTTVDQHTKRMGNLAAKLFIEQTNTPVAEFAPRKTLLNPELVIRDSSVKKQEQLTA